MARRANPFSLLCCWGLSCSTRTSDRLCVTAVASQQNSEKPKPFPRLGAFAKLAPDVRDDGIRHKDRLIASYAHYVSPADKDAWTANVLHVSSVFLRRKLKRRVFLCVRLEKIVHNRD